MSDLEAAFLGSLNPATAVDSRFVYSGMIPTEDASARKREIEEKLKQVRTGQEWKGREGSAINEVFILLQK